MHTFPSLFLATLLSSACLLAPAAAAPTATGPAAAAPTATGPASAAPAAATGQTYKSELFHPNAVNWPGGRIRFRKRDPDMNIFSMEHIRQAMKAWEQQTCIRFDEVPASETKNVIELIPDVKCGATDQWGAGSYTFSVDGDVCASGNVVALLGLAIGLADGPEQVTYDLARAVNEKYGCDNNFFNPNRNPDLSCSPAQENPNSKDESVYRFVVDGESKAYAREGGNKFIAIKQGCRSYNNVGGSTQNWGFTPLEKDASAKGFDQFRYEITMNRCKKDYGRWAEHWSVFFCTEEDEKACHQPTSCSDRRGTCVAGNPKNVLVDDPLPFICRSWTESFNTVYD